MDTTVQNNNINGTRKSDHGLEFHTQVHGMDYLVPLWWEEWLLGGNTEGGRKDSVRESGVD
jgi:hypothetical protein